MSARSAPCAVPATISPAARFRRRLRRLARTIAAVYGRWLERQALAELDDRLLEDVGLTRAERDRECRRSPFDGNASR